MRTRAALCLVAGCSFAPGAAPPGPTHDARADGARDAAFADGTRDTSPDAVAPPTDFVAYYPMEALPMVDATGHGHDGTCVSCPTVGSGVVGSGFAFARERVDVPTAADLRTESGTAAAWLAIDAVPTEYACVFGAIYDVVPNGDTWQLCLHDSTIWQVFLQTGSGATSFTVKTQIVAGAWHHVAITWTPALSELYVDGQAAGSDAILPLVFDPNSPLTFGGDRLDKAKPDAVDVPITGRLDEVKLYNRALGSAEIAALMAH